MNKFVIIDGNHIIHSGNSVISGNLKLIKDAYDPFTPYGYLLANDIEDVTLYNCLANGIDLGNHTSTSTFFLIRQDGLVFRYFLNAGSPLSDTSIEIINPKLKQKRAHASTTNVTDAICILMNGGVKHKQIIEDIQNNFAVVGEYKVDTIGRIVSQLKRKRLGTQMLSV